MIVIECIDSCYLWFSSRNWEVGDKINGNIIRVHCDVDFMKHLNNWRLQKFYYCCFLQTVYRDINIDGIQIQAVRYWQISVLHPIWMPMLEFRIQNSLGGQKLTSITIATDGCHGNRYSLSHASFIPQNEFARHRDPFNHLKLIKNMQKSFLVTSSISSWQMKINVGECV